MVFEFSPISERNSVVMVDKNLVLLDYFRFFVRIPWKIKRLIEK